MNARFADLTLAEAARRLRRYRPLVLTLVLTLGILRALPESSTTVDEALEPTASASATSPSTSDPVADATPAPPSSPAVASAAPLPRLSPREPAVLGSAATTTTSPPVVPTPPSPAVPTTTRPETAAPTILHSGWATRAAGTPAETVGVPEGSLPVGNRLGQTDKASFLRLGGDWQSLALAVDPDGTAGIGEPTVQACAITTAAWEPLAGSSFAEAPEWNPDDCVAGVAAATGDEWTFAIGGLDQRFGVALVPGPAAPVEFQIAFRVPS